jgi:hypothetical protein
MQPAQTRALQTQMAAVPIFCVHLAATKAPANKTRPATETHGALTQTAIRTAHPIKTNWAGTAIKTGSVIAMNHS